MIDPNMQPNRMAGPAATEVDESLHRDRTTACEAERSSAGPFDGLAWLVLSATFVLICATFRDYGIPWDGQGEARYGEMLLRYYASWFHDRSAFEFLNLRYYGGAFELTAAALAHISPFGLYETRHLLNALIGLVGLAGTWRLARAIGGPRTGALAAVLLVLCPSWYGHMFVNARDIPFASGLVWCLVATLRVLEELPVVRWRSATLFGLAFGLTISVRVGGFLALLFLALPVALWLAARARRGVAALARDAFHIVRSMLPALPVAYAVMIVLWPWAALSPLNPLRALMMFSSFPFDASVLFEGKLISAKALPASYLPVQIALRSPEVLLVGIAGGALLGGLALWKRGRTFLETDSIRVLTVAFAAAFPVLYSMLARPVDYNGMRHFLFVLPPLAVIAALAFDRALQAAPWRTLRTVFACALATAVLMQTRTMVKLHPDEYVYFNRLVSGPRGAQDDYELDYWGLSLAEATRRLTDQLVRRGDLPEPGRPPYKVYVCGNPYSASEYFPPWLTPTNDVDHADFQIAIAEHFCKHATGSRRMLDVTRGGAVLSFVEDLRPTEVAREPVSIVKRH